MARSTTIGNHLAPPRFILFIALLGAGWAGGIGLLGLEQGAMIGFDLAALGFLISCVPLFHDEAERMRQAARDNDANRLLLLGISIILSLVVLVAVARQLRGQNSLGPLDIALIIGTLVLTWTFANAVYALHYAHLFYTRADGGKDMAGLDFPGDRREPDFADFTYFAFTLGVALQTSDVVVTSPHIRVVVIIHCVAAFFFNLGVLALTINILSGG